MKCWRWEPVAAGCGLLGIVLLATLVCLLSLGQGCVLLVTLWFAYTQLRPDRWALVRTHRWKVVRHVYQSLAIYHFCHKIDRAYAALEVPMDAWDAHPRAAAVLDAIIATGPATFQAKATNRAQIESLVACVSGLVQEMRAKRKVDPLVLDLGAGKALLTRAVYEVLDRRVAVIALDSRRATAIDQFYDPLLLDDTTDAPYTRLVANVRQLAALEALQGVPAASVVAVTKHLCGGATDASLVALCEPPLHLSVGACCLAPCCHQKTKRLDYCNLAYLQSLGFCQTHTGLRGGTQDADWKTLLKLISMAKVTDLHDFEYKKSKLLHLLGFARARELGRRTRRLLEEGRMRYLRSHGFDDVQLVRYCDESVTSDNLAILARKRHVST